MRTLASVVALVAVAACHKSAKPEWELSGVGAMNSVGALNLFDRTGGSGSTQCGLAGVVEPPDDLPPVDAGYRDALTALAKDKVLAFTVVQSAETLQETKTTRITRGLDQCAVTVDGAPLGATLVGQGWGRAAQFADKAIVDAEAKAKAGKLGMWSPDVRAKVLERFAQQEGNTAAALPLKADATIAEREAKLWQPRLAYLDIDFASVMTTVPAP
jgi:hypothetical protein